MYDEDGMFLFLQCQFLINVMNITCVGVVIVRMVWRLIVQGSRTVKISWVDLILNIANQLF